MGEGENTFCVVNINFDLGRDINENICYSFLLQNRYTLTIQSLKGQQNIIASIQITLDNVNSFLAPFFNLLDVPIYHKNNHIVSLVFIGINVWKPEA